MWGEKADGVCNIPATTAGLADGVADHAGRSAMFDRYTDRARKVMGLARQEAQRLNHIKDQLLLTIRFV